MSVGHPLVTDLRKTTVLIVLTYVNVQTHSQEKETRVHLEDSVHLVSHCTVLDTRLSKLAHELVYGRDDICHLFTSDATITVDIIQREGPAQLLVQRTSRQDGQSLHEVLEHSTMIRGHVLPSLLDVINGKGLFFTCLNEHRYGVSRKGVANR